MKSKPKENIFPDSSKPTLILVTMCMGLMLAMFNSSMSSVLIPDIGIDFGSTPTSLQWVATIYTLGFAIFLLPGSSLGIHIGRRKTFLIGVLIFIIGSIVCATSPDLKILLTGRLLQSVGVGVMIPQTLAIIVHEYKDKNERSSAIGVWAGVASIGLISGPLFGGGAVNLFGWRAGFLISFILATMTLIFGYLFIPKKGHSPSLIRYKHDVQGLLLSAAWLFCLVFSLNESTRLGWSNPIIVFPMLISFFLLIFFIFVEKKKGKEKRNPIMPLSLWCNGDFVFANVGGALYFFFLFGVLYFYSLLFQKSLNMSAMQAGVSFLPLTCTMGLSAYLSGKVTAKFGMCNLMLLGLTINAISCFYLSSISNEVNILYIELGLALAGIGSGLMSPSTSNGAVSNAPAIHSGIASAIHNTCRQIGSTLGVALLGTLINFHESKNIGINTFFSGIKYAMLCTGILLTFSTTLIILTKLFFIFKNKLMP